MALKPMMARSSIGNGLAMPGRAIARPPTPASVNALPRAGNERANERRAERVAGFLRGDEIDRQRSRPRRAVHRRASPATPTKKILARSAAALTCAGSATIALPAATARPGKTGARDVLDGLRPDRRQIKAAILAGFRRLDQNADAGRLRHAPLAAQLRDAHQQIVGAFGGFDGEHVAIGDDHGLTDIERPERGDDVKRAARCRRDRAAKARSGRARLRAR